MTKITESELLLVAKAKADKVKNFTDGASLVYRSGVSIKEIQIQVTKDRLALAKKQLKAAVFAGNSTPQLSRTAVSRAYYAMYQAARAVTYLSNGGDDHEEHSVLPGKLPDDFSEAPEWRNKLKNARLERNRADYDPYPKLERKFKDSCDLLIEQATEFVLLAQQYINSKLS
jgi:uncharacterized protein (UPF0332 family)